MRKLLITGATGNVGLEILSALHKLKPQLSVFAGVREPLAARHQLDKYDVEKIEFDFNNINTF
ncbi:MAG TPA: hypothetical protein VJ899_09275 [Salegentibacter sp.]|nr:hypothetical protein [Salegentibacter sp.]